MHFIRYTIIVFQFTILVNGIFAQVPKFKKPTTVHFLILWYISGIHVFYNARSIKPSVLLGNYVYVSSKTMTHMHAKIQSNLAVGYFKSGAWEKYYT